MLAFGLAFVPSIADAQQWWQYQPEVVLSVNDVSNAAGNQVEAYGFRVAPVIPGPPPQLTLGAAGEFEFFLKVTKGRASVNSGILGNTIIPATGLADIATPPGYVADQLDLTDLRFTLLDEDGVIISQPNPDATNVADYIGLVTDAGAGAAGTMMELVHTNDLGTNVKVTVAGADFASAAGNAAAVLVHLPAGSFRNVEPAAVNASLVDVQARATGTNKKAPDHNLPIILVPAEPEAGDPYVVSIVRIVSTASIAVSRFQQAQVTGPFQIRITLTEEGHNFAAADGASSDFISVVNGKLTGIVPGVPFLAVAGADPVPPLGEGNYTAADPVPAASGRDQKYHPYLVTIEPDLTIRENAHENRVRNVEIRVKAFNDLVIPANGWVPPTNYSLAVGRSLLEVPINPAAITDIFKTAADAKTGNEIFLPDKVIVEPGEYLVIARGANANESGVVESKAKDADKKTPAQKLYTTVYGVDFPYPGDNLDTFFRNGGQIALLHEDNAANTATNADNKYEAESKSFTAGALVISEIMWGTDLHPLNVDDRPQDSQWIELLNTTDETIHIDKNEWTLAFYSSAGAAPADAIDVVGNVSPYWQAKGSGGSTQGSRIIFITDKGKAIPGGTAVPSGENVVSVTTETYPVGSLASMYRAIPADKKSALDGTLESSWTASAPDGTVNLSGPRYGTPGGDNPAYVEPPTPPPTPPTPPPTVPAATAGDLMVTEIMVASSSGRLPQWIEITNTSVGEVSLDGWMVGIDNDAADADVVAASLSIKLDGVTLDANQSVLVVSKTSNRNSGVAARAKGDDNAGALDSNRIVNASSQINPASMTYSMLSEMSFRISLEPPLPLAGGVTIRGDVVGNLGGGWELPMSETGRSSIIRREMGTAAAIMGTDAAGWVLASGTGLSGAYVGTFYGDKDDVGTPGYDAGEALPVELSKFSAARDRVTGQVVITWETQSELNNAGFYIKRSQQRTSQFVAVNPTMVPGAGTTSEKQTYTYTDTTAQPNIVYYYQIEDVSLDGNRQTLTRAHRLRGHIGAAGKATTTWGELKSSHQ